MCLGGVIAIATLDGCAARTHWGPYLSTDSLPM